MRRHAAVSIELALWIVSLTHHSLLLTIRSTQPIVKYQQSINPTVPLNDMTRRTRNEDQEERRLRERKETKYRNGSESDSGEERRKAEAERRRNARKRKQSTNINNLVLNETHSSSTNSNLPNFRAPTEEGLQESEQIIDPGPGTSRACLEGSRKDDDERNMAMEERTESKEEEKKRRNREAQQRRRQRLTEQRAQEIRERDLQAHQQQRERLTEEEIRQIRERDSQAHQQQRENLTEEEAEQIRQGNTQAHRDQRNNLTPQQRSAVNQQRRNNRAVLGQHYRRGRDPEIEPEPHDCKDMTVRCSYCWALYFEGEHARQPNGTFNPCCKNGKLKSPFSRNFFDHIREFNTAHAFASMQCERDKPAGRGPYVYKVHGEVRHYISPARPATSTNPLYGQLYFVDETVGVDERLWNRANGQCNPALMALLTRIVTENHYLAHQYQQLATTYANEEAKARQEMRPMFNVTLAFKSNNTPDPRKYNAPRVPELAIVYVGPDQELPSPSNFVMIPADGRSFTTIPVISKMLDPSIYPLFFFSEQFGWHPDIQYNLNDGLARTRNVSQKEYYCYYLSRRDVFNPILYGRRLMQQFVVGSWANTEQCRLNYIRRNQRSLRSDFFNEVQNFIADGQEGAVGARILLPSSFTSSPRYMVAQYQDAMSITARFGKPDLFLTFTCNPKWREITDNIYTGQTAADRPDIVARVFRMKLDELLADIWKRNIFGQVTAYIYTVEWQKRGLPHAHMLFTLASNDKPLTPDDVDSLISAELPEDSSTLKTLVTTHMIHRDCGPGSICWVDGKCSKGFPKPFQAITDLRGNDYVVPHNPYLLLKYNAHINLEICSVIHATKYLFKYVYKGSDKARLQFRQKIQNQNGGQIDEIAEHLDGRYVCAPEAFHRLFAFDLQGRSNAVIDLMVHEKNKHSIYFQQGAEREAVQRNQSTTLLAFFAFNQLARELKARNEINELGPVDPHNVLYAEFPEHFTYDRRSGKWKKKGQTNRNIGRIHSVSVKQKERYSIRLLLLHTKGACSFDELFTVNQVQYQTAHEAALAMGLLQTEDHFDKAMHDANFFQMPRALRGVFACLMSFHGVSFGPAMFEKWKKEMSEDYAHSQNYNEMECYALAYFDIAEECSSFGINLKEVFPPPLPVRPPRRHFQPSINHGELADRMYGQLNRTQLQVVDSIVNGNVKLAFLDGPGGSGKTFTYECIYHKLKAAGKDVSCVAWTGIAANLLPNGRTVASFFKMNLKNNCETSLMKPNSIEGRHLKNVDVIIIDEVSMISNKVINTIDVVLRDVTQNINEWFGGKTVLIGGDFRQVLPIPNKQLGQVAYDCCIKHSTQFPKFHKFCLTENMRASDASSSFKEFLLSVGEDIAAKDDSGKIEIPREMISDGDLIEEIFQGSFNNADELSVRAILCPKNVNVDEINKKILARMDGESRTFFSVDSIEQKGGADRLSFSDEFLHSLNPSELPPHVLELKIGSIVVVTRNLNVKQGLCNGTRLQVDRFGRMNAIQCKFINGARKGDAVVIPRIDLKSDKGMSFELKRRQFPLKLAFAMTINKSQGQSLERVGIYLPSEVFSHGQLYVALSKSKKSEGIKVLIPNNGTKTTNVVDTRVL